jgi:hypothetical protein
MNDKNPTLLGLPAKIRSAPAFLAGIASNQNRIIDILTVISNMRAGDGVEIIYTNQGVTIKAISVQLTSQSGGTTAASKSASINTSSGIITYQGPNGEGFLDSDYAAIKTGFTYEQVTMCVDGAEVTRWIPVYTSDPT